MRKPEAEIYRYVLEQEHCPASDAVFFDDNEENVTAARALGIKSILVTDNKVVPEYFA